MSDLMNFDLPKSKSSIIKVIGVGGGGSNAINYMYNQGIEGVDFIICNTDYQALETSPVPNKIQLGVKLTEGLGAGSVPAIGKEAAMENISQIKELLRTNTKMVFITAGMGGGTGTGAAPIIAEAAKEMGILTVGIVTLPFGFEGRKRKTHAEDGINELRKNVDTLLVICNDKLREIYGNLSVTRAFSKADDVLTTAARGIAEIVTKSGMINVDFNDVRTVMTEGGAAIMGYAIASGENRARNAIEAALTSPLLNDNTIVGAKQIWLNITTASGEFEASMDEITEITEYVYNEAGGDPENLIYGVVFDDTLGDSISVVVIATHLEQNEIDLTSTLKNEGNKKIHKLENDVKELVKEKEIVQEEEEMILITNTNITSEETSKIEFESIICTDNAEPVNQKEETTKKTDNSLLFEIEEIEEDITICKKEEQSVIKEEIHINNGISRLHNERKDALKKISERSLKLNNSDHLKEIEGTPAYVRRNIQLDDIKHSSESDISRYTLSEGDDNKTELRENNSFLHDNVD